MAGRKNTREERILRTRDWFMQRIRQAATRPAKLGFAADYARSVLSDAQIDTLIARLIQETDAAAGVPEIRQRIAARNARTEVTA